MLVLKRKYGEKIKLSNGVILTVTHIEGSRIGIGIEAPQHIGITRSKPCMVCGRATFDYYLGYLDIPFCGDERCAHRIRMNKKPQCDKV